MQQLKNTTFQNLLNEPRKCRTLNFLIKKRERERERERFNIVHVGDIFSTEKRKKMDN